jgi:hypothetical protein
LTTILSLSATLSFLSSRADDLAGGEVMKSMNKTRPKSVVDSIWFNILYIGSEAEGSAVPRTSPGNVFRRSEARDLRFYGPFLEMISSEAERRDLCVDASSWECFLPS